MANKVKYGISNVYYALATENPATGKLTYGVPVKWPGARAISLEPQGETTQWPADNVTYWTGVSNSGYEGDLTMARIIDSFHTDVLGAKLEEGVMTEYSNILGKQFALLFQFEGDEKATRHVLYNCTAGRAPINGNTVDGNIEPEEEAITITANPRLDNYLVKARTTGTTSDEVYNAWFTQVWEPTPETNGGE